MAPSPSGRDFASLVATPDSLPTYSWYCANARAGMPAVLHRQSQRALPLLEVTTVGGNNRVVEIIVPRNLSVPGNFRGFLCEKRKPDAVSGAGSGLHFRAFCGRAG